MFGLFKKQNPWEEPALKLYTSCMEQSRRPEFYTECGVPDTMDGRFDLLLVHIFLVLNRLLEKADQSDELSQAIFDVCFIDMDQALRECGIGDMGIKKHMKRMMLAFNGRMHAYDQALDADNENLEDALKRNLFGTIEDVPKKNLEALTRYITDNIEVLAAQDIENLRNGAVSFKTMGK